MEIVKTMPVNVTMAVPVKVTISGKCPHRRTVRCEILGQDSPATEDRKREIKFKPLVWNGSGVYGYWTNAPFGKIHVCKDDKNPGKFMAKFADGWVERNLPSFDYARMYAQEYVHLELSEWVVEERAEG